MSGSERLRGLYGKRVAVLGDLNLDIIALHRELPGTGSESLAEKVVLRAGGAASNFSIALGALGFTVCPVAAVGTDPFGDFVLSELSSHNVDVSMVQRTPEDSTGICYVAVACNERTMFTYRGANRLLDLQDSDLHTLTGFDAIHISFYALLEGRQRDSVLRLLGSGSVRKIGLITLDLCPPFTRYINVKLLQALQGLIDVLFLNEQELEGLLGMMGCGSPDELASRLNAVLVVKRGSMGAVVHLADGTRNVVRSEPIEAVNPTGAGDVLAAGFVAGLLSGLDPVDAAALGSKTAGVAVRSLSWRDFASTLKSTVRL
jgi:sugar/nucleoside kinase (ribokinase family)